MKATAYSKFPGINACYASVLLSVVPSPCDLISLSFCLLLFLISFPFTQLFHLNLSNPFTGLVSVLKKGIFSVQKVHGQKKFSGGEALQTPFSPNRGVIEVDILLSAVFSREERALTSHLNIFYH